MAFTLLCKATFSYHTSLSDILKVQARGLVPVGLGT
jgi:hypothetical protein